MGTFILSILLAVIPLVLAAALLFRVETITVDGLFTTLILLTISGIFGFNAFLDLRQAGLLPGRLGKKKEAGGAKLAAHAAAAQTPMRQAATVDGVHTIRGKVEGVLYFEAAVGQPNKSIVTIQRDSAAEQIVFSGDVRNALPKGKRLEITFRSAGDHNTLVEARDA